MPAVSRCRTWRDQRCPPDAAFRIRGRRWPVSRTAQRAYRDAGECRCARAASAQDKDTAFAFSMEGNNSPSAPRQQIPFAQARAGTHRRHGTNSRRKWAVICVSLIRVCVCSAKKTAVWITSVPFRHLRRRRMSGRLHRIIICSAVRIITAGTGDSGTL